MKTDRYGQIILDVDDLCAIYMRDSTARFDHALVERSVEFSDLLELEHQPRLVKYTQCDLTLNEWDTLNQNRWLMPQHYSEFDIAQWVLDQCTTEAQLQRVGQELLMYQEREMFVLLRYLKYLVDTMTEHNIVWGVGRGSSVASYVLYIIGIHSIDSMYYDLDIHEFLK